MKQSPNHDKPSWQPPEFNNMKPRFSRKMLNALIIIVILLILVFIQTGKLQQEPKPPLLNDSDPNSQETNNDNISQQITLEELEQLPLTTLKSLNPDQFKSSKKLPIQHWQTKLGTPVYFVAVPEIPILDIQLTFYAGAAQSPDQPGLAKLTSRLLRSGTTTKSVDDIAILLEGLGAALSTSSHRDMSVIKLRSLAMDQQLTPALSLLTDILQNSTFPEEEFNRHLQQMLTALKQQQQDPHSIIQRAVFKYLYPNHPYQHHPLGTESSLHQIKQQDTVGYFKRFFNHKNVIIAIVGAINKNQAEQISEKLSQALPSGHPALKVTNPQAISNAQNYHIDFPSQQSHLILSSQGIPRNSPDYASFYVGNTILGGGGFSSLLNQTIRQDHGLSYSVYSTFTAMATAGPFKINLQTKNENVSKALSLTIKELDHFLEHGPTNTQLKHAKRQILGSFPLSTASNSSIVSHMSVIGFYQLPLDFRQQLQQQIAQVTITDIKNTFNKYIDMNKIISISLGPEKYNPNP